MNLTQRVSRRKLRAVWTDPVRRVHALATLAAVAAECNRDLLAAARLIADKYLRHRLERHAEDALRHAQMFRDRAAALRPDQSDGGDESAPSPQARDGLGASLCEELGEIAYVAMLHVAEQRACNAFEIHAVLTQDDAGTRAVFEAILKDKRNHVAETGRLLDRWRDNDQEVEVRDGLRRARSSRVMTNWRQLGLRSGAGFSRVVLRVLYWTALVPFGILSRPPRRRPASQPARRTGTSSQY